MTYTAVESIYAPTDNIAKDFEEQRVPVMDTDGNNDGDAEDNEFFGTDAEESKEKK